MIKEFEYKKNETSEPTVRRIIAIHESAERISGIDLSYLTEEMAKEAEEAFKDYEPTPFPAKGEEPKLNENWKPEYSKAFRTFIKSKIAVREEPTS